MRKRRANKHLPERVYFKHGAYYYVDTDRKWHLLGEPCEAMHKWSQRVEPIIESSNSVSYLTNMVKLP